MSKRILWCAVILGCLMAAPAAFAQSTITCGPLDDGRVANVIYKADAIFFDPIVRYEYEFAVLRIAGPCEDITRTFKPGEAISFSLAEVERVLDGSYEWELRFMPAVDAGVREKLQASRGSGEEDDLWWSFFQQGFIPDGPRVDSAGFTVIKGSIVDPGAVEEGQKSGTLATKGASASLAAAAAGFDSPTALASAGDGPVLSPKDIVHNDDVIIHNSLCVGFDCVNGEVFNADTIRLKENNLRIHFDDTSSLSGFPTRNWRIVANSQSSGGSDFLAFEDSDAGNFPLLVEGAAGANALRVDNAGRVGLGTANPVVELHVVDGDTPALRLDQNTSSGFASQVWDVAGNETSFFVRDATNGSTLPFRIFPGASSNSLIIDDTDNVGLGTTSPTSRLDLVGGQIEIGGHSIGERSGAVTDLQVNALRNTIYNIDSDNDSTNASFSVSRDGNANAVVFVAREDGLVGVNRQTPSFPFHVGTDATNGNGAHVTVDGIWTDGSSRTNKTAIRDLELDQALSAFRELNPVRYRGKNSPSGEEYLGFIAEDVPELVAMNSRQGLSPMDIVALLTKVVQDQQTTIERLTERLDELETDR